MLSIIGIFVVLGMVFGGYILAGGKMDIVLHALPLEGMMIGGAALGAFFISNQGWIGKQLLKDFSKAFKGPKWKQDSYIGLLSLLFELTKLIKTKGMIALEEHIENPKESTIFRKYDAILHDHFAVDFICDSLRLMSMSFEDPYQLDDLMQDQIDKHHHEAIMPASALQVTSEGFPAIGIVAAVLGVIKTMGSINQPVEVLGKMIGGALVGTFLGVFLSYCFVGPFAHKINFVYDEEGYFYKVIKVVLVSHLHGNAPQVSVEIGRSNIPSHYQPSFKELEEKLNQV